MNSTEPGVFFLSILFSELWRQSSRIPNGGGIIGTYVARSVVARTIAVARSARRVGGETIPHSRRVGGEKLHQATIQQKGLVQVWGLRSRGQTLLHYLGMLGPGAKEPGVRSRRPLSKMSR